MPGKGIFPRDAVTSIPFTGTLNTTKNLNASLSIVTTGTDSVNSTEHVIRFGNATWYNAFDNLSASHVLQVPVTSFLNVSGNSASIESTIRRMDADYLVNRNAILVIGQNNAHTEAESNPIHLIPGQSVFGNSSLLPGTIQPASNLTSHPTGSTNSSVLPPLLLVANTAQPCRLTLHSNPEGALIFVDGIYLGKTTPYTFNVTPGEEHSIRMELDGFLPAERNLTANNDTSVCEHLYLKSGIYSPKGQTDTLVQEREMTHDGGLYIRSRPGPATISLNGILMPQRTPAVVYGLKEGTYTVKLSLERGDLSLKGASDIQFADQEVYVHPYCIVPVDVAANNSPLWDIIIDSRDLRGEPFTVNGHAIQKTIPDMVTTPTFDSFITIFHNLSYVSYPLPALLNEDHYLVIQPRDHDDLNVFVDSKPRGAEVFIDGFRTGFSTPYSFTNISDGPHRIMVSKTGFIPQESIITLLSTPVPISTTNVTFSLDEYQNGFLRVASDPSGAEIGLDGMDTGEITPFIFFALPTGSHSIIIGNKTVTRKYPDITVNALVPVNISADFREIQD